MPDTVIQVENLGKMYTIGHQQKGSYRYTALRDVLADGAGAFLRKLRRPGKSFTPFNREEFWALKDLSFEIKQGEMVGIIGRNGAGKSTLLKILSRITEPTTGRVRLKGRVASLLEVGTGFHPELTGRENIFLNGAILGMRRAEINHKFDEIVDFAEVSKFLDTPVKRYSSGMYVRLAFSVAAHLDPEILIIDEVLAVGDIQFQKKCLKKLESIEDSHRTIVFVSHNMSTIKGLCSRALLIKDGEIVKDDMPETVATHYLADAQEQQAMIDFKDSYTAAEISFLKAYLCDKENNLSSSFDNRDAFAIHLEYKLHKEIRGLRIGFLMETIEGIQVCGATDFVFTDSTRKPGIYKSKCLFPAHILNSGKYTILFGADKFPYTQSLMRTEHCLTFEIEDIDRERPLYDRRPGIIKPTLTWQVVRPYPKNQ
ncbi:ABC transporter ATP-binding protein [Leptothoe spongobia]|uniref:ABC transporter ATP-binding protein n=1 Tax=Leptothoe spongobia TAU-MAC 1115 TaxID=1967444 RepID=A0A947DE07_9CYAN|nr:ABC transporter ATP-binding protein [Leptothoe spongobia]MBT9315242.1 ABC transporter ATP-binding protein [Leptothoe spongobia TAU-MAC 1115]